MLHACILTLKLRQQDCFGFGANLGYPNILDQAGLHSTTLSQNTSPKFPSLFLHRLSLQSYYSQEKKAGFFFLGFPPPATSLTPTPPLPRSGRATADGEDEGIWKKTQEEVADLSDGELCIRS